MKKIKSSTFYAMYGIQYYPPPQQEFLELIRKTVELESVSALEHKLVDTLITAYKKAYPDAAPTDVK